MVSIFIFEKKTRAIVPAPSQKSCFLKKKNLSPIVELASDNDEIEIKNIPIKIRLKIKKNSGDFFTVFMKTF